MTAEGEAETDVNSLFMKSAIEHVSSASRGDPPAQRLSMLHVRWMQVEISHCRQCLVASLY